MFSSRFIRYVSTHIRAPESTVTSLRSRVGFISLTGLLVMRKGSGVAPTTWLCVR